MKTTIFVRMALWSLCVYIFLACGQPLEHAQSFTSSKTAQSSAKTNEIEPIETTGATVYVCNSSGAKKYHYKETCRGLIPCKHEVITMKIEDAEKRG